METAFLLIALGFGYKIYADASVNAKNRTKKLGKIIGVIMMVFGLAGAVCVTTCKIAYVTSACIIPGGDPMVKMFPYGKFMKSYAAKGMCPIMGKSQGSTHALPEIPSASFTPKSIKEDLK